MRFVCAVPRYIFKRCHNPAIVIVRRRRGVPLGKPRPPEEPTFIEEPACSECSTAFITHADADIRNIDPEADALKMCGNPECESGALTAYRGLCPTCIERERWRNDPGIGTARLY